MGPTVCPSQKSNTLTLQVPLYVYNSKSVVAAVQRDPASADARENHTRLPLSVSTNTRTSHSVPMTRRRQRRHARMSNVRAKSRFLRRPCRSAGGCAPSMDETGYPKKGFKRDVAGMAMAGEAVRSGPATGRGTDVDTTADDDGEAGQALRLPC